MKINLAVLPGDGIGPEIVEEALLVTETICEKFGHDLTYQHALVGASAIDEVGDPFPRSTYELCVNSDAVLFGAIGAPKYDDDPTAKVRPEQGLLKMRQMLGLYANIRPVRSFSALVDNSPLRREVIEGANFLCIRELTGGLYFGKPQGRSEDGNTAYDTCIYNREEVLRIIHLAFQSAERRRKKLTIVDKANVLATSRLWREIAKEIEPQYPEVEVNYMFVDNAAMQLILNPKQFDVIVTENLFGDILTDEASVISGSLGMLPSASVGLSTSLFEPIHGSYPSAAGKNIANPIATILSVALMFEMAFNLPEETALIREAVQASMDAGVVTEDIAKDGKAYSTTEVGRWIAKYIRMK